MNATQTDFYLIIKIVFFLLMHFIYLFLKGYTHIKTFLREHVMMTFEFFYSLLAYLQKKTYFVIFWGI